MIVATLRSGRFWLGCAAGLFLALAVNVAARRLDEDRTTVSVRNQTPWTIPDLKIEVAGVVAWSGTLAPQRTRTATIVTRGDGVIAVEFTRNGEHIRREYGYVTHAIGFDYYVSIPESGEPVVEDTLLPATLTGWFRDGER